MIPVTILQNCSLIKEGKQEAKGKLHGREKTGPRFVYMFVLSQSFRIYIEVASETWFWLGVPSCSELYQHKPSPALSLLQSGRQGK